VLYEQLRWSVTDLTTRRVGSDPGAVDVRFVVDKMAVVRVFLRVFRLPPSFVSITPQVLIAIFKLLL
jgi:hypothetical protein